MWVARMESYLVARRDNLRADHWAHRRAAKMVAQMAGSMVGLTEIPTVAEKAEWKAARMVRKMAVQRADTKDDQKAGTMAARKAASKADMWGSSKAATTVCESVVHLVALTVEKWAEHWVDRKVGWRVPLLAARRVAQMVEWSAAYLVALKVVRWDVLWVADLVVSSAVCWEHKTAVCLAIP